MNFGKRPRNEPEETMKTILVRAALIVFILIPSLTLPSPLVTAYGGEAVGERSAVADWTVLGLDVPGYDKKTHLEVPLEERRWIRHHKMEIRWNMVQPQAGEFDWSNYDNQINAALSDGSQSILLLLSGPVPKWARDASYGGFADKAPPTDLNNWYAFCAAVAERYGSVVDFYEIWNEPGWDRDGEAYRKFGTYHFGGQVETDYLPLLQLGYTAIKEKDPAGIVMCGALINTLEDDPDAGTELYTYLFDDAVRPRQDTTVTVTADSGIEAGRALNLSCFDAGTADGGGEGADSGRTAWFFAEGCTRPGFDTWLSIRNDGGERAAVNIDYYRGDGSTERRRLTVPARSLLTLPVFEEGLGAGRRDSEGGDVSIGLSSDRPITAERSIYFNLGGMQDGDDEAGSPQTEWRLAGDSAGYTVQENICLLNPGPEDASTKIEFNRSDGSAESTTVEIAAQSRKMLPVPSGGSQPPGFDDISVGISCEGPVVAERSPRFYCSGRCAGEYISPGVAAPREQWDFTDGCDISTKESMRLVNPVAETVQATLVFSMGKGQTLSRQVPLPPQAAIELDLSDLLGFDANCDMVAVHPYKMPGNWGPFYANLVQAMHAIGVDKELAVTEVGWPHLNDDDPNMFSEQQQADAMGDWGIGPLREAGCRKIWIYKDMDEKPGKSWDKNYYGLFGHDGGPHAAWYKYKEWQGKNPEYPALPTSLQ